MSDAPFFRSGAESYRFSTREDLPDFAEMLADPEVGRWLWFAPLPEGGAEAFFTPFVDGQSEALAAGETPSSAVFTVEDREGGFLGQGAVIAIDGSAGGFEIGFQLARRAWGRGVGTRLGRFLCAYAIVRCDAFRIEGGCLEGNERSVALLRKLGLRLEGMRPGYRLKEGERHAELLFGAEVSRLDLELYREVARSTGLVGADG